mmetsp:Transcript_181469/g.576062  ORF Transcript_181469/g.576062 Transcript_181469/m.576062 type:complete len:215 (+) Transcript_181469:559-1203(+)
MSTGQFRLRGAVGRDDLDVTGGGPVLEEALPDVDHRLGDRGPGHSMASGGDHLRVPVDQVAHGFDGVLQRRVLTVVVHVLELGAQQVVANLDHGLHRRDVASEAPIALQAFNQNVRARDDLVRSCSPSSELTHELLRTRATVALCDESTFQVKQSLQKGREDRAIPRVYTADVEVRGRGAHGVVMSGGNGCPNPLELPSASDQPHVTHLLLGMG